MSGLYNILNIGKNAASVYQTALEVTSNNIANVNTEGYSRQTLVIDESLTVNTASGTLGTGVTATNVLRYFDKFIESSYVSSASLSQRWETFHDNLSTVEAMFNESNGAGISSSISDFFSAWQILSQQAEDYPSRISLLSDSETLVNSIQQLYDDLEDMQAQMNDYIGQDVDQANLLMEQISELNKRIDSAESSGNTPNTLYDDRTQLVRELADIIDINIIDNGGGDYILTTTSGYTLVEGSESYKLAFESAQSFNNLTRASTFEGAVYFEGSADYEYTLEITQPGSASNGSAKFKVSLDGGQTWLKDEDGNVLEYECNSGGGKVQVGDLNIWFGSEDSFDEGSSGNLVKGDKFTIVPKSGLYWYSTTSSKVNITPQTYVDGSDNTRRATGGTLAAYFGVRDDAIGSYKEKLDAFANELVWQINLLHSQGAGEAAHTYTLGTYSVASISTALSDPSSGLSYGSQLSSGSSILYVYDADTGELVSGAALNFASTGFSGFNPATDSLEDVAAAINNTFSGMLTASIVNKQLQITAEDGYEFQYGADTAGLFAALGLNTFFMGDSASNIDLNSTVTVNSDFICAGQVDASGDSGSGDNNTALAIADLADYEVTITTGRGGTSTHTLAEYYNSIVTDVGSDVSTAEYNYQYQETLAAALEEQQSELTGVNLDEELTNLIKFQHSYTAAAKLIAVADELFDTVIGLVR
ncbi:MAG: flagellar hook-associated protein 1 [Desulfovibrionales bacterium]|nr:flagellar hook-associated protein 1 [Desulfovibrionales bacterium]